MRRSRSTGITLVVAILIVGLATPATAKKGGNPGPPSDTGLDVTVEPTGVFMWANSVGDEILFDISVANTSGGDLTAVTVAFNGMELVALETLEKNGSWTTVYTHTVVADDFYIAVDGQLTPLAAATQTDVPFGIVSAAVDGEVLDSTPAVTTAYPVLPCPPLVEGSFTWGPSSDDYTVCALTPGEELFGYWTFETTLPKPKKGNGPASPAVTVRDGVPGNWCNYHYDENGKLAELSQDVSDDRKVITDRVFFPTDSDPERQGVCLNAGAGGDEIPVRNHDTFYLATWKDHVVVASPGGP